jgi:uncharacterized protein (DUF1499 family)
MKDALPTTRPRGSRWCAIGSWLAGLGLAGVLAGILGARAGLPPLAAFSGFGIGSLLCALGALLLLVGLGLSKGTGGTVATARAWGSFAAAILVVGIGLGMRPDSSGAPAIHDLSTDLADPPAFDALVAIRKADGAQNPPEYAGDDTAAAQRNAFPDLQTLALAAPPDTVYAAAERVAQDLGWEIVARDTARGMIEATDTTSWFRFKDDVVIRVTARDGGSAVDVRSKSRVGRGDMGTNAQRIRLFLDRLEASIG